MLVANWYSYWYTFYVVIIHFLCSLLIIKDFFVHTYQTFCRHMQNIKHASHISPRVIVCVCVCKGECWLWIKGSFPTVFMNQSDAGSLQTRSAPHPPSPSFVSLLRLINPPVFPSHISSLIHKLVSAHIFHLSSRILPPFPLLCSELVQSKSASAGDWLPTNKANHSDMKGCSLEGTKSG